MSKWNIILIKIFLFFYTRRYFFVTMIKSLTKLWINRKYILQSTQISNLVSMYLIIIFNKINNVPKMFRGIILHQHIKCIFQCVEWNNVGIVLMSDGLMIWEGNSIKTIGGIAQILVSDAYLGYVINAITKPIDGRGEI